MTKHSWKFKLDGKEYNVLFEVKYNGAFVTINGQKEKLEKGTFERLLNPEYKFTIGGKPATIAPKGGGLRAKFDLAIDEKSVSSGEAVKESLPIPIWAWVFAIGCIAIPVVSLGGAIPAGIGFGGAAAVIAYSKNPSVTKTKRLAVCAGITAVAWLLFVLLILAIMSYR